MKNWPWVLMSVLIVALDQISKYWVALFFIPYQSQALLPMLNLTLAYNSGAAFSFLSDAGHWRWWFFTIFSTVMSLILTIWLARTSYSQKLQALALSLILGGAVGNLIDRIRLGYVIDFIDVYYKNHHWPVFNLADSAICLGAFFLLCELCKNSSRQCA